MPFFILTNNPLVAEKLGDLHPLEYVDTSFDGIFSQIRDKIHKGHVLLTHPLSGSIKPHETPYKSVLLSKQAGPLDAASLELIEQATEIAARFTARCATLPAQVQADFQLVDLTLIESALASAVR